MSHGSHHVFALLVAGCAVRAPATLRYVDLNSAAPTPLIPIGPLPPQPFRMRSMWLQPGTPILVTNGLYATGGQKWFDSGTNRVAVTNALVLQSVNGPAVTVIQSFHGCRLGG